MASNITRQQALTEAINLGNTFLERAEPYADGIAWKTAQMDFTLPEKFVYKFQPSIYSGTAGISLFLAELFYETKDEKYRIAAVDGMKGAIALTGADDSASMFTGKLSVAFALTRIDELAPSMDFMSKAVEIALQSANHINHNDFDLINGICGTMVGLMHVHAASNDDRILPVLNQFVEKLLTVMYPGRRGVRWDRTTRYTHSICGFSHGASGFAYAFTELARYLNNNAYLEIANQAFRYESQYFNERQQNWRDLRGPEPTQFSEEIDAAYQNGNIEFFLGREKQMHAWCHGAPGIGLAKLRMMETFSDPKVEKDVDICIDTTYKATVSENSERMSSSLCHGLSGNAEIFIETYRVTRNENVLQKAWDVAEKVFLQRNMVGRYLSGNTGGIEDDSLFMGNAGIGYFMLRLLDPDGVPSMLNPSINKVISKPVENKWLSMTSADIHKSLVRSAFRRTLTIADAAFPEKTEEYFKQTSASDFVASWRSFVAPLFLHGSKGEVLEDIFNLENTVLEMNLAVVSDQLLFIKDQNKKADFKNLASIDGNTILVTDSDISCVTTKWKWNNYGDLVSNLDKEAGEYSCLLVPTFMGVYERIVAEFNIVILETFDKATTVNEAVDVIATQVDASRDQVYDLVLKQIRHLCEAGHLLDPARHKFNTRNYSFKEALANHE